MFMTTCKKNWHTANDFIIRNIFPVGWLILLTGMFWLDRSGTYHRLFYWLLLLPCILVLIGDFRKYCYLLCQPLFLAISVFLAYMLVSLLWSNTDDIEKRLLTTPFIILAFMLSAAIFHLNAKQRFEKILYCAAVIATIAAAYALVHHNFLSAGSPRLVGSFLLDNPLLTAHVYGAFAVFWIAQLFLPDHSKKISVVGIIIIGILLVQTGSRTPFVGIGLAVAWFFLAQNKHKKSIIGISVVAICLLTQYMIASSSGIWAGYSYRPEIWAETIRQISEAPWFGHGFKAPITINIGPYTLIDPHNIELAVFYEGGIVGLMLWIWIYVCALRFAWHSRKDSMTILASTWLVYGIGAGLTEGRHYVSLPKEHWFLIWIPMAILFAASALQNKQGEK